MACSKAWEVYSGAKETYPVAGSKGRNKEIHKE